MHRRKLTKPKNNKNLQWVCQFMSAGKHGRLVTVAEMRELTPEDRHELIDLEFDLWARS
jgi:hypothetical protein